MIRVNMCQGYGKIGDTAAAEPALRALAEEMGQKVSLHVHPDHHGMFAGHPSILPTGIPNADPYYDLSCVPADWYARNRKVPFAFGYYGQVGLDPVGRDGHFQSFSDRMDPVYQGRILVVPYSYTCGSRRGHRADYQPPLPWWDEVLPRLPGPVTVLTGNDPEMDPERTWPGADVVRGLPLDATIAAMRSARLVLSVNTGLLHLSSASPCPKVFLCTKFPWQYTPRNPVRVVSAPYADQFDPDEVVRAVEEVLA